MFQSQTEQASTVSSQDRVEVAASGYTPGPWASHGSIKRVNGPDGGTLHWCGDVTPVHEVGGYRGDIATVQSCDHIGGISREEAAANARLIAAAPDLLSAAKGLLALLDDGTCTADPEESEIAFARAIIAKAEK